MSTDRRWWVGWYGDGPFEYHGPWWVTGAEAGGRLTFCAAVHAPGEDAARAAIIDAHDAERPAVEFRFVEERGDGWEPFSERFPRAEWMQWPDGTSETG